ncbi:MAG TPA: hypothetical protein VIL85_23860 [Thermomicrobiales bacterium]|jgi:hypothetical protein
MKTQIARLAFVGATAAILTFGVLTGGAVSAKTPDSLTLNPHTLEATAPAGFTPGEQVGVWYNLPDGTAANFEVTTALPDGTLDWTIDAADYAAIPADAVNLVAEGWQSDNLAIYTFTSRGASAPVALSIDSATFEAKAPANFIAGEEVGIWYNLPDGTAVNFGTTTALADGSLDWTIASADFQAIPANAVNLVAQGFESTNQAIYTFMH